MHTLKASVLTLAAWLLAVTMIQPAFALDLSREVQFSIPAQGLDAALVEFSRQAQLQVVTSGAEVGKLKSSGVTGTLSIADALDRLLRASGLSFRPVGESAISIGRFEAASRRAGESRAAAQARTGEQLRLARTGAADEASTQDEARTAASERTGASAADRGDDTQEMVVTGTNIKGVAPAGSPVIVIDEESIRQSGYSSTEQLLHALPQNFRGGQAGAVADLNMSTGSLNRVNGTAGSGVNLRGLGSASTLVLINGRRISASSAGTFTDISMIPIAAIERIEILSDGASAIYGADAVAGVINVILKQDYNTAETRARYGFTTESGRDELRLSQNYGMSWNGGGMTVAVDYLDQSQLMASERDFTANVIAPNSIFPADELTSGILSARQRFGQDWELELDVQHSRSERQLFSASSFSRSESTIKPERTNAVLGLSYDAFGDWTFNLNGSLSQEHTRLYLTSISQNTGMVNYTYIQTQEQDQHSGELLGSGSLFDLPGGALKLAFGGSHREEDYFRLIDLFGAAQPTGREVTSAFMELHIPLVGAANARPGIHRLDLSVAGRHDDYSDFGSSTNPKIGVSWSPGERLTLRSSYSTSFRAPSTGFELFQGDRGVTGVDLQAFFAPDGNGFVPVVLLFGSKALRPEESKNWTFGFTWEPGLIENLTMGFSYYDISYSDRIIVPPFDFGALANPQLAAFLAFYDTPAEVAALVNDYVAQGAFLSDFTGGIFGPDPLSQITTVYSYLQQNADSVDVKGFDLTLDYPFSAGPNQFNVAFNANYIDGMVNVPAPGALPYDLVGTFANPPNLRFRTALSWYRGGFNGALNLNYTNSYTDTSGLIDRRVETYVTLDTNLRYSFARPASPLLDGVSVSLFATNLFDESPPFVTLSGSSANYDGANANPLGRFVGVEIAKRW
jgi:outer membrane receptor protein involved in Fe transport